MRFISCNKSIPKSISHSGGIPGISLGKTSGKSLTTGTDFMGGISESKSWTHTMWYKHPLEIILKDFEQEIIRPLGIEFPLSTLK